LNCQFWKPKSSKFKFIFLKIREKMFNFDQRVKAMTVGVKEISRGREREKARGNGR
jgi:hypothetical protein